MSKAEQISPESAEWLHGPRLVEWLRENGLTNVQVQLGRSLERRVRHWHHGATASVYTVDQVLTKLGLHLHEIPDGLWIESPKGKAITDEVADEAVRRVVELKKVPGTVARELGIDPKTVKRYVAQRQAA